MPLHRHEQRDRGRRVRAADVVRDLGEVADGGDPVGRGPHLEDADEGRRDAEEAGGSGPDVAAEQARARRGPEDRHGPGVRARPRDRPEADPLDDAQGAGRPRLTASARLGQRYPAPGRRGRAGHGSARAGEPDLELGPRQLREPAVHDLEGRTARPVVEQPVGVEGRDDRGRRNADQPGRGHVAATIGDDQPPAKRAVASSTRRSISSSPCGHRDERQLGAGPCPRELPRDVRRSSVQPAMEQHRRDPGQLVRVARQLVLLEERGVAK